ncbi:MAG: alpha/beta fold hydrolase [Gaiellales bacterium]
MIRPALPYGADARLVPITTGVELSVTDRGTGLPLVLIHGVSMSAAYFHPVIDPLVDAGYRVVVPDLRGHGRSPAVEGGHTVGQYADDVHALLDALAIERCALVGWSMGSLVSWELMHRHGRERIAAHVNISQGPTDLQGPDFPDAPLSAEAIHGFIAACQADYAGAMAHFAPAMFKDELDPADLAWCAEESSMVGANAGSAILLDQTLYDARAAIASGSVPTLNLWGTDEKLIPRSMGAWCEANIPGSRLVVLEGSGHCPQLEEPDRAVAEMTAFLAEHAG